MKMKAFMLIMLCLLIILGSVPSSSAVAKPRFVVIGEGNFEAFCLQDGTCVVTDIPYIAGYCKEFEQKEQTFLFSTHSTDDAFVSTQKPLKFENKKIARDKVKHSSSDKNKVDEGLEKLHLKEARWKTVEFKGGRFILSEYRSRVSPDQKKFIVSSSSEDSLWIYDADKDIIQVTNVNGNTAEKQVDDNGTLWFSHIRWSHDGKRLAYDSSKNEPKKGSAVWILDSSGTEKFVCRVEGRDLSVLGWSNDNRIVVQADTRQGEIGLCSLNGVYEIVATGVWAIPDSALSPNGRFLAAMKVDSNGGVYGACLIDLQSKAVYDFPKELAGSSIGGSGVAWSANGQKVAFFVYSRKDDKPELPYTAGARLAVIDVTQKAGPRIEIFDAPYDGTWFYIGGSISWVGDRAVIASLTNAVSVALEVK